MIEPGRGWAYVALFSEIGVSLLVTSLFGVLAAAEAARSGFSGLRPPDAPWLARSA